MAKFYHVGDDEWVYPQMKGYKMVCCDCGLVHNVDFEVYKETPYPFNHSDVPAEEGYKVRLFVERNERSTTAARREDRKRGGSKYASELIDIRDKLVRANPDLSWQEITSTIMKVLND